MFRILLFVSLFFSLPAWGQANIAVVDMQRALHSTKDGKQILADLKLLQKSQETRLRDMDTQFRGLVEEFKKQEMILSEDAKRDKQLELQAAQQELQAAYVAAQAEVQKAQQTKGTQLITKLMSVCQTIGKEQGYAMVIDVAAVVYTGNAVDVTDELIKRYDAGG